MKKHKIDSIGDVIAGLEKSSGLGKQLQLAELWERWEEIAGPKLAPHGRPLGVQDGRLRIVATAPVWMNRYAYQKLAIMRRVNKLAGRVLVDDVFVALLPEDEALDPDADD